MSLPVILMFIALVPNAAPVVTEVGTFSSYSTCKVAADSAAYHHKQGQHVSFGFVCIEKPLVRP